MITTSMTLVAIFGLATSVPVGAGPVMIQAKPLGADGLFSGSIVKLASSDRSIVDVTSVEQLGQAPVGLVGKKSGVAVITATALDGSGITATLNVTVP